jgi:hypothetical protein
MTSALRHQHAPQLGQLVAQLQACARELALPG